MKLLCPICGAFREENFVLEAQRDITCSYCDWKGSSEDLLAVPDHLSALDPAIFNTLHNRLAEEIAPHIGVLLQQLHLVEFKNVVQPEQLQWFAELLRDYTRAGFAVLMERILEADVGQRSTE